MRLTLKEKKILFELLDVMTDKNPHLSIDKFDNEKDNELFRSIFKKVRLELKGF